MAGDRLLTVRDAARLTQQSVQTVRRWIYEDVLPVERVGPTARVRVRLSTLRRMFPADTLEPLDDGASRGRE